MKHIAKATLACAAAITLAGCGHGHKADAGLMFLFQCAQSRSVRAVLSGRAERRKEGAKEQQTAKNVTQRTICRQQHGGTFSFYKI